MEHVINNTLAGLTAQIQQLTQLITSPAPPPTVALPPIPMSPPPVSPPLPVPSTLSKQRTRLKLPSPSNFSGEQSSGRAFFNSCMLYLCLAPEQFSCDKEKILWTLAFFKDEQLRGGLRTSFARKRTPASFPSNPGSTSNNNSGANSFCSIRKQMLLTL